MVKESPAVNLDHRLCEEPPSRWKQRGNLSKRDQGLVCVRVGRKAGPCGFVHTEYEGWGLDI